MVFLIFWMVCFHGIVQLYNCFTCFILVWLWWWLWFDDIFFLINIFVFYLLFSLIYLCMLFELFVFGHISFVRLFANYFWNLYMLYELFVFGHVSCEVVNLFVYLGFGFRFLIWGYYFVIIWIYSLIFLICDNYLIWNMFLIFIWYFCV